MLNDARDLVLVRSAVDILIDVVPPLLIRNGLDAAGPEVRGYVNENGLGPW